MLKFRTKIVIELRNGEYKSGSHPLLPYLNDSITLKGD